MVFTTGRSRTDSTPNRCGESTYEFLDRVAGEYWEHVRALIVLWHNELRQTDDDEADEVRSRLQSGDETNFDGACWELLLHSTLKADGHRLTAHPQVPGTTKKVDYLVESDDESFYLEATVVHEDQGHQAEQLQTGQVYDALDARVTSEEVFLWVEIDRVGYQTPSYTRMANAVDQWLHHELDVSSARAAYEAGGIQALEGFTWDDEDRSGWVVTLLPVPKKQLQVSDRIVGVRGGAQARCIDDQTAVRKALARKVRRYGSQLDRPLVVALGMDRIFVDNSDIMSALFGDEAYAIPEVGPPELLRRPNGLWWGPTGRARKQRLSAVITANRFRPWEIGQSEPDLWLHPQPDRELLWDPGWARTWRSENHVMHPTDRERTIASLHVADRWPPGEPFPRD